MKRVAPNLYKRGDFYHVRLMRNGIPKTQSTGKTTLKAAIKEGDKIKVSLRNNEPVSREVPTFREYSKIYQSVYTSKKANPGTDTRAIAAAQTHFGGRRLDEITKTSCQQHLNNRSEKVADSTLDLEHAILQAVFQKAVEDGLIDKNPWKGIDKQKPGPRIRVLSEESELKLRAVLDPVEDRWLTFMLETGLRLEECRGVGITEVDLAAHLAHVPMESAKYSKPRSVPLSDEAEAAIRAQADAEGKLWHSVQSRYRTILTRGCLASQIGHISPHDLRHTFATRYLKNGGDIYILSKILGHSSVTVTEHTYVHLQAEDLVAPRRAVHVTATKSATTGEQPTSTTFNQAKVTLSKNIQEV